MPRANEVQIPIFFCPEENLNLPSNFSISLKNFDLSSKISDDLF